MVLQSLHKHNVFRPLVAMCVCVCVCGGVGGVEGGELGVDNYFIDSSFYKKRCLKSSIILDGPATANLFEEVGSHVTWQNPRMSEITERDAVAKV